MTLSSHAGGRKCPSPVGIARDEVQRALALLARRMDPHPSLQSACGFVVPLPLMESLPLLLARTFVCALLLAPLTACANDGSRSEGNRDGNDDDIFVPDEPVPGVSSECGSVRLTTYDASDSGWCEFSINHAILPDFVRENLTLAIAEPYNGSSYNGESGEACGECWEISTISATQIVMVNNLCPIEGNPLCAGGHFHFDLTQQAGEVLGGGGNDEAATRRVPCPVTGNIHAQINNRNEWGYVRVAFINHRVPIRTAEYRSADGDEWSPVERSGGAWHILEGADVFADGAPGGVFRFTSPTGETVEGTEVLTEDIGIDAVFDTGAQFAPVQAEGPACVFTPPGDVYDEEWGGIDQVRWQPNPWGGASVSEVGEDCADGPSCVLFSDLEQWAGFHIYYRQSFPVSTFSTLTLQLRTQSGSADLVVAPSHDGERCEETSVTATEEWATVTIDVAQSCTDLDELNALTVSNNSATVNLLVDEIFYE